MNDRCPHGTVPHECPLCRPTHAPVPPTSAPPPSVSTDALLLLGTLLGHRVLRAVDAFTELCDACTTFVDKNDDVSDADTGKERIQ